MRAIFSNWTALTRRQPDPRCTSLDQYKHEHTPKKLLLKLFLVPENAISERTKVIRRKINQIEILQSGLPVQLIGSIQISCVRLYEDACQLNVA